MTPGKIDTRHPPDDQLGRLRLGLARSPPMQEGTACAGHRYTLVFALSPFGTSAGSSTAARRLAPPGSPLSADPSDPGCHRAILGEWEAIRISCAGSRRRVA